MPGQQRAEQLGWIIDQLSVAAVAKGQVFTQERLRINAEDLVDIPQDALVRAFARARQELDYLPGVSEIRRLAMADTGSRLDAEMRSAWDLTIKFVDKYVSNDIHGNYGPEHGWHGPRFDREGNVTRLASYPELEPRILDVVRRTGGWKQYKCMTENDQPFQQKRFFEEYKSWLAVEQVTDTSKLLAMPMVKQLPAEKKDLPASVKPIRPARTLQSVGEIANAQKRVPKPKEEHTDEWYAERRARLKRMADELVAKRKSQ